MNRTGVVGVDVIVHRLRQQKHLGAIVTRNVSHAGFYRAKRGSSPTFHTVCSELIPNPEKNDPHAVGQGIAELLDVSEPLLPAIEI
jgi:hypothetical protein